MGWDSEDAQHQAQQTQVPTVIPVIAVVATVFPVVAVIPVVATVIPVVVLALVSVPALMGRRCRGTGRGRRLGGAGDRKDRHSGQGGGYSYVTKRHFRCLLMW
ncbi:hypothetical protein AB0G73_21950 [Streptomyces sp. NPDC020719]|uniref:hypothetical protein n=1 Tax=Streptomyces sp. NPDC020719 TaxID=3154896 RepID=UPI0033FC8556